MQIFLKLLYTKWYILRLESVRVHPGAHVPALWDFGLQQWCLRRGILALHSMQKFLLAVQAPEVKIRPDNNLSKGVSSSVAIQS